MMVIRYPPFFRKLADAIGGPVSPEGGQYKMRKEKCYNFSL